MFDGYFHFRTHRQLLLGLILCLAFASASAQPVWCDGYRPVDDHPLNWSKLEPKVDTYLVQQDYESAYRAVLAEYDAAYAGRNAGLIYDLRNKLMAYLQSRQSEGERPSDWQSFLNPGRNSEMLVLDSEEGLVHEVSCDIDAWQETLSADVAVFYLAYAMERLASDKIQQARAIAAYEADSIRQSYEDWLFNGFAMWPWELKLNELRVDKSFLSPAPKWQLTALRPSLALAIRTDSFDRFHRSQLDHALVIEPLGFVRYVEGSRYRNWWGISPIITVTDDNGAGYGILARYNELTLGAAQHESVDELLVYFSLDLYQYLLSNEDKVRRARTFFDQ